MVPDAETAAIAQAVSRMDAAQIAALRDRLEAEVLSLEARRPERTPMDDPARFALNRDRATCARRRREVAYLNRLLAGHDA